MRVTERKLERQIDYTIKIFNCSCSTVQIILFLNASIIYRTNLI